MSTENVFVHSVTAFWRTGKTMVSWRKVDGHEGQIALTLGNYPAQVAIHMDRAGLAELAMKIGHAAIDMEAIEARVVCRNCGPVHGAVTKDANGVDIIICNECFTLVSSGAKK